MKILNSTATLILLMVVIAVVVAGCVSSRSSQVYSRDEARRVQIVENGTVESVKEVMIEGTKTSTGNVAGAVAGGILGSTIGGGSGKKVATLLGVLAGATVGTMVEEKITQKTALEIIVKKDNGQTIVVVQEADAIIAAGDRVRIITGADGTTRVSR